MEKLTSSERSYKKKKRLIEAGINSRFTNCIVWNRSVLRKTLQNQMSPFLNHHSVLRELWSIPLGDCALARQRMHEIQTGNDIRQIIKAINVSANRADSVC